MRALQFRYRGPILIPISKVQLPTEAESMVLEVLRSGRLAQGHLVKQFEDQFAELCNTEHAVAVNSGTSALVGALQAIEVGPGDEVITSPFTFVATVNAILEAGASVIFADVSLSDALMCVDETAARCTDRTRAIMPVHLYGQMADMVALRQLAAARNLRIIEDAAQAHGARRGGLSPGQVDIACFSMYGTKNLTTPEGGMVTTDDSAVAERLRILRNQGMRERYEYVMVGHNYRMTEVNAAIGLAQMPVLADWTALRRANAQKLLEGLAGCPGIEFMAVAARSHSVYHQFTVRVTDQARVTRDDLVEQLTMNGVGAGVYYPRAVGGYDCYRTHPRITVTSTPNAEQLAREVISLPVHQHLTSSDLDHIIQTTRSLLGA